MNYYKFHLGDYSVHTSHLSNEEDLCYRRAIDLYMLQEGPLANDKRTLSKRLRVSEEILESVLNEFFELTDAGWVQPKYAEQIAQWNARGWFPHEGVQLRQPIDEWKATRIRIFARDNWTCQYCNRRGGKLECDHYIPVSRGGSNTDNNLKTACFKCNRKKSNKMPLSNSN